MASPKLYKTQRGYFGAADRALPGGGLGGYVLPSDCRFVFARGEGANFWDVDNRQYIDYVCGAGALILGHSHPAVVAAVNRQNQRGAHMFGVLSDVAVLLARRLCADIPCADKIAFATTGSEANAYAIRLARAFTGRDKILKFEGAYHGNHDYTLVSTFPPRAGDYPRGSADTAGRPRALRDLTVIAPYNDLQETARIAKKCGRDLAAIMVEPVQRIIAGDLDFLTGLRKLCDQTGALLIFDEVVTGFRLAYGGFQAQSGIIPDLATFGKVIGGGGPLAVVAGRADIVNLSDPRKKGDDNYAYFNGTLHGNPPAAAATLAALDELKKPGVIKELNDLTEEFCQALQGFYRFRGVREAQVARCGSLWQVLFMDKPPRCYADIVAGDAATAKKIDATMIKFGHYTLPGVRRFVSVAHTREQLQSYINDTEETLVQLGIGHKRPY